MKYFEHEATSRSDSWGTCVPARMMVRAGDGDDRVGDNSEDEVIVGGVGTHEDVKRFMFPSASARSSRTSSGDFFPERLVSEVAVFTIFATLVSVGKHASTSKRTIIFMSSISC